MIDCVSELSRRSQRTLNWIRAYRGASRRFVVCTFILFFQMRALARRVTVTFYGT